MNVTGTVLLLSLMGAPPTAATEPLCDQRVPCGVTEVLDAGQDEQGQSLQVKRLSLGWTDLESGSQFVGRKFGPGQRKAEGVAAKGRCEATEWWLLRPEKPAQLLLSLCNDGQGAVREEEVSVSGNRILYTRTGVRRGTRWSSSRSLQLSPLRLASDTNRSWRSSPTGKEKEDGDSWDYELLRGEVGRDPSDCQPGESNLGERILQYLPRVQVDEGYLANGWKQAGLGECGLGAEHFPQGMSQANKPGDAGLKALLVAKDTLLVEITDEKVTGPSAKWLNDDHVELWLAPMPPHELSGCGEPTDEQKPVQWAIRLADGKAFPAFGAPKEMLQVERAELPGKKGYRLKVTLPVPFRGLGVVFSDSDTGKKPETRVATNELKSNRPELLNPVRTVFPEQATCAVQDGELAIVPGPELKAEPDKAVLQDKNL